MRRFGCTLVFCMALAGPALGEESAFPPWDADDDPFMTVEEIHPYIGDPIHDGFPRAQLSGRGDDPMAALAGAFPDTPLRPLFLGTRPGWRTAVALVVPLAGMVALAWSWVAGVAGAARRRRNRGVASVAAVAVVFALVAWSVAPDLWHRWWTVPHEGNSGRTLQQLYQLFHWEFLRSELVWFLWWLNPGESMPPVAVAARLTLASLAASVPVLVAAGVALGAGVVMSLVGVATIFASPLVAQYALSDHPIGGIALFTGLAFLAVERAWRLGAGRGLRVAVGVALACFQVVLAELRAETLVLWLVADAVIVAAWIRGGTPGETCERWATRLRDFVRGRCGSPSGLVGVALLVLVLLMVPALFLWLPFRLFENPRVLSYFPFMTSAALWGLFAPGFLRMAEEMAPAAAALCGLGLAWGLLRPLGARGIGIGIAASLAATWVLGHSQTDWIYARLTASLAPVMTLLGIQAMGRLPRAAQVGGAAFLAGLTVVLPMFGSVVGGGHWVGRLTAPPLRHVDNTIEAHTVFDQLVGPDGSCLIAPVLAVERAQAEEVPHDRRRIDLLVLERDFAARVLVGIRDEDGVGLADAVVAAGSACERPRLYLGLDCSLQGLRFCDAVKRWFEGGGGSSVEGVPYTAPRNYGRRKDPRLLEILKIPTPEQHQFIRTKLPEGWN